MLTFTKVSLKKNAPWTYQARYEVYNDGDYLGTVTKVANYGATPTWIADPKIRFETVPGSFTTRTAAAEALR
jgi:hypothetical protein